MKNTARTSPPPTGTPNLVSGFEIIDPNWLLKAIGLTLLGALVCGYLTLCLLFYQGQWQLVLHPTLSNTPLTKLAGLPAQPLRFDAAETGTPRLSGALIPSVDGGRYRNDTVLYLRGGDSTLAHDATDADNLALLHALGLNLFAFDYRGYGQSDSVHPNQARMSEDAVAALRYLVDSRSIPETHIILYGVGVGASLAAALADTHPHIPALILDTPGPDPLARALVDPRTRLLPVRSLFHENFSLNSLKSLNTPKLLISHPGPDDPLPQAFARAADPKTTLELAPTDPVHQSESINRFLDQNVAHAVQEIKE